MTGTMEAAVRPKHGRSAPPVAAFAEVFGDQHRRLPGSRHGEVARLRAASLDSFMAAGIPTVKAEPWKYTNVARVANLPMALAPRADVGLNTVAEHKAGGPKARRIIFVNGHVVPGLSHVESLPAGVRVMSLARALEETPDRVRAALDATADDGRSFTALNAAFAAPGAWIELEDGAALDEPLQLLFLTTGDAPSAAMTHPRNVVRLGARARLRLIESHVALGDGHCLTNLVNQVSLGEGATLEHDRLQLGRDGTSLIGKSFLDLAGGSTLRQTAATLGGALMRNENEARLLGERAECVLSGAYLPRGREHVDNLIRIHHARPNCQSDQFFKGVLDEQARAVFAGKIIVHKDAQKTNAYQKNDNLLLSDDAEVDAKPELEIYADDVKCSHGATVGDLDPKALFYLRSRGLDRATAASILTFAFAAEALDRFADATVKKQARHAVAARLPGGAALRDIE